VLTSIKYQHTTSNTCPRPIILVANKSDLERSRMIGKEGQYSLTLFVQYVRYAEQSRYRPTIFSMSACLSALRRLVCLRRIRTTLMAVPLPEKCIWPRYDLDLWPLTLKVSSAISTHMTTISAKFHCNSSTKYRDIASREIGVNGRTDGQPETIMFFAYYCWWRHIYSEKLLIRN